MNTMENRRSTSFVSILVILLCFALCAGATYAYFTDSVTSGQNKVQAGKLNVDLQIWNTEKNDWYSIKNDKDPVFAYNKWEPGYTDVQVFKVVNQGNLAFKWEARIESDHSPAILAEVIDVYIKTSNEEITYPTNRTEFASWEKKGTLYDLYDCFSDFLFGELMAKGDCAYFGIALKMQEDADNTYRKLTLKEFDIVVYATQLDNESDAFGSNYDDGINFPPEKVRYAELEYKLSDDGTYYIVSGMKAPEKNIIIPDTYEGLPVQGIGYQAFYYWEDLGNEDEPDIRTLTIESITISNNLKFIGEEAFAYSTIDTIAFTEGLESIGVGAFRNCTIGEIVLPEGLKSICESAFSGCEIKELTIPEGITKIEPYTFSGAAIETLNLPDSLDIICEDAFRISNIKGITIPEGVTRIEDCAFEDCEFLEKVTIPASVEYIGDYAFTWNFELGEVTFAPNSKLKYLGAGAFSDCYDLQSLVIPEGVQAIAERTFMYCSSLKTVSIPSTVTSIGANAFDYCSSLESLEIPAGVTFIGEGAFSYCSSLKSFEIPAGVTSIGASAFYECTALVNIVIPAGVTSICSRTFEYCYNLQSVEIPKSVTSFDEASFSGCSSLAKITFTGTVDEWDNISKYIDDSWYGWDTWNDETGDYTVYCTDGQITKDGTVSLN